MPTRKKDKGEKTGNLPVLAGRKHGQKMTVSETVAVFVSWLKCDRNTKKTAAFTGVSIQMVARLVNHGHKSNGVPSFKTLVREYAHAGLMYIPQIHDDLLKEYKWNERKAVAQTLMICEGVRDIIWDAVLKKKVRVKTVDEVAKLANAVGVLEKSLRQSAKALDLVDGEAPPPRDASDRDEMQGMTREELDKMAGVIPIKEPDKQTG